MHQVLGSLGLRDDLSKGHGLGCNTIITTKVTAEKKMNRWARRLIPFGVACIAGGIRERASGGGATIFPHQRGIL